MKNQTGQISKSLEDEYLETLKTNIHIADLSAGLESQCHRGIPVASLVIPSHSKSLFRYHCYDYFLFMVLWDQILSQELRQWPTSTGVIFWVMFQCYRSQIWKMKNWFQFFKHSFLHITIIPEFWYRLGFTILPNMIQKPCSSAISVDLWLQTAVRMSTGFQTVAVR